ncbi:GAF domain-containing protein [Geomonas sp. RF6]|uniref:GAF domain-containing protein n=1 Tax=Geomonas sp. RF6 TaxID=2897342 RepID=UPI001E49A8C6|nr:GAF domain-containing protein [Geomonas sp. RF6]UFS72616.1 GAF domain-containing protein [Geomonas sp. RF6]
MGKNGVENQGHFLKLVGLSALMDGQDDLENGLSEIVEQMARIARCEICSMMLFREEEGANSFSLKLFAKHGELPKHAFQEAARVGNGIAGQVAASGKPLMVQDIENSPYLKLARRPESDKKGFICVPILISGKVVGVLNMSDPVDGRRFTVHDLDLVSFLSTLTGKSIQVNQLQKLLRSRYLQLVAQGGPEEAASVPHERPDTGHMAQILARSFYKEMAAAGFGSDHIIGAATEIISQLNSKLARHRARRERQA